MTPKLKEAAQTINRLAKDENDTHLRLCRAIAAAMDLVKKESNLSWREWADQNLRKPDGSKWAMWTLYSYASYGRDPRKLERAREGIRKHGKKARRALRELKSTINHLPRESGNSLQRQVAALMFAWNNASSEARALFLEKVLPASEAA